MNKRKKERTRRALAMLAFFGVAALVWQLASRKEVPAAASQTAGAQRHAIIAAAPTAEPSAPVRIADPLLVLVNAETALPEDWDPELVSVGGDSQELVDARAYEDLTAMTQAARESDIWFWVCSGYRSREVQEELLREEIEACLAEGMSQEEAEETALRLIQAPGHSEHETGLAVDFNDASEGFADTGAYPWLLEHAAEYGFVQRYKEEKESVTGIASEPWHFRYVGRENALEMERQGYCLEEYVQAMRN